MLKNESNFYIEKLEIKDFNKCSNIWDMQRQHDLADRFYNELLSGNRVTFVYIREGAYIGEGSIVFDMNDPDYTIEGKRIYFSRLIVKQEYRHQGIGSTIVDFIIDYVKELGYSEISIGVDVDNYPARALYAKKGFSQVIFQGIDEQGEYQKLVKTIIHNPRARQKAPSERYKSECVLHDRALVKCRQLSK